jgi:signal transduction histidine kinase
MVTLQRLIDDVIDVTRLQNGKFNINLQPVRLYTLLAKVVEVAQMLTKKQLEVEPATEVEPLWVKADTMRLEQAILNLITNAITHAPTSSKISLNLRKVEKHNMAEIRVQDYGAGIKAEYLGDVFNRFYQVTHGLPSTSTGLGLGLFICQQIVLAHGGTISVESIEGEGATFIVLLPLIEPAE